MGFLNPDNNKYDKVRARRLLMFYQYVLFCGRTEMPYLTGPISPSDVVNFRRLFELVNEAHPGKWESYREEHSLPEDYFTNEAYFSGV